MQPVLETRVGFDLLLAFPALTPFLFQSRRLTPITRLGSPAIQPRQSREPSVPAPSRVLNPPLRRPPRNLSSCLPSLTPCRLRPRSFLWPHRARALAAYR